jgi:DNA-binding response OmpR family regulator
MIEVLIVEDNLDIQELMAEAVSYLDCTVDTASNGDDAMKKVMKKKPDIMVLDINMPKKNGFEVLRTLKGRKTTQDVYVIVFTVRSRPKDVKMGYELGADVYFDKPRDVIPEVKKAIELIKARRENQ